MPPKKYLQQINYFELSIADPHKSVLAFTKVMSHKTSAFPPWLFLETPPILQTGCSIHQSCLSQASSEDGHEGRCGVEGTLLAPARLQQMCLVFSDPEIRYRNGARALKGRVRGTWV